MKRFCCVYLTCIYTPIRWICGLQHSTAECEEVFFNLGQWIANLVYMTFHSSQGYCEMSCTSTIQDKSPLVEIGDTCEGAQSNCSEQLCKYTKFFLNWSCLLRPCLSCRFFPSFNVWWVSSHVVIFSPALTTLHCYPRLFLLIMSHSMRITSWCPVGSGNSVPEGQFRCQKYWSESS